MDLRFSFTFLNVYIPLWRPKTRKSSVRVKVWILWWVFFPSNTRAPTKPSALLSQLKVAQISKSGRRRASETAAVHPGPNKRNRWEKREASLALRHHLNGTDLSPPGLFL